MVVGNGMERNPNIFSQDYPTLGVNLWLPHWLFMGVPLPPWSHGGPWSRGNELNKQHGLRLLVVRVDLGRMFFFFCFRCFGSFVPVCASPHCW